MKKEWVLISILAGILFVLSLSVGKYHLSLSALFGGFADDALGRQVFLNLRLPRSIVAAFGGFALALVGSVMQTIFKNPLASPDIMGVSSGASVGAACGILFLGGGLFSVTAGAFAGGLLAVSLAILLTKAGDHRQLATFVVSGLAVNALAQALLMLLKMIADPHSELAAIEFWMMGGLGSVTMAKAAGAAAVTLPALILILMLNRQVSLLSLPDTEASALGVNLKRIRPALLVLSTLVVAGVVSVTGLISFIGLIAPHLSRLVMKRNNMPAWLLSGAIGACLLLTADMLSRSLSYAEIPVSILTSLIGVPVLIAIMVRGGRLP